jgi:hypothetical protein
VDPASTSNTTTSAGSSSQGNSGAILGAGASTPSTGADTQFGAGLALLTLGGFILFGSSRRSRKSLP